MRIAFAGNPNSGKTTMYNALLAGLAVVVVIALVIVNIIRKTNKNLAAEYALSGKK